MASILERISAGDDSAVAACIDEYGGLVWRLATRYLNSADVEDAVQEVFLELWLKANRFDPARGKEHAFIATIARRRLIDRRRRMTPGVLSLDERRVHALACDEACSTDDGGRLAEAFRQLPDDERRTLWLALARGYSHREIGEATSSPIGTVKTRLRRALLRLRDSVLPEPMETGERA